MPELLNILGDEVGKTSVNVSRRDGVDTGKVPPLVRERPGHMDATSLCDVVRGLLLGVVGDVARHGGSDDERAVATLLEVESNRTCAVECSSQVGGDDLVPLLNSGIENAIVGSLASIGNENIDLAEVVDDILDKLLALCVVADLALVGLDLDAILLTHLLGILLSTLSAGVVGDGKISTVLSTASGSLGTDTGSTRSTGDDNDLALKAEEVLELGSLGNGNHCEDKGLDVIEVELRLFNEVNEQRQYEQNSVEGHKRSKYSSTGKVQPHQITSG